MGRPLEFSLLALALALVAARELWVDTAAILAGQLTGTPGISATLLEVFLLLSICVAHLAFEKPNWQMFGVYIVSLFSAVVGSIWLIHPDSGPICSNRFTFACRASFQRLNALNAHEFHRSQSYLILIIFTGLNPWIKILFRIIAGLLILVSAIIRTLLPLPKLPKLPNHRVGTQEFRFNFKTMEQSSADAKALREDLIARGVPQQSEMRVRLWYPTDSHTGHVAPYLGRSLLQQMIKVFMDIEGQALERVTLIASHILLSKSNSWLNADLSAAKQRWPLLVMSHGLKASPEIYSAYAEYFASQGFIVAAPAHTDGSCPENWKGQGPGKWVWEFSNAQVRQRVMDISFLTNHLQSESFDFSSRIDWNSVLVCGHSFGGATSARVLKYDYRFIGGIAWDTWMWSLSPEDKQKRMAKEVLFINSEWFLVGEGREVNLESVNQVCRSNADGGHVAMLKDTAHHNYNDLPLLVHPSLQKLIRRGDGPPKMFGGLSARRALEITMETSSAFLKYVIAKKDQTSKLGSVKDICNYSELEYELVKA